VNRNNNKNKLPRTVVLVLKTLILSQLPALKTTFFPKARCPADIQLS